MERQTGVAPEELQGLPLLPIGGELIWNKYWPDLNGRRTAGMTLNPITWPEIESWCRLRKIVLQQWELDAILSIDDTFRIHMTSKE